MLDNYGVSKSNIGFILDATYTWIISLVLLVCMCYRPQRGEPRSRQEADEIFGSRSSEESRIFKATVTVLLFFFNLLHWGMFVSFSQVSIFYIAVHVEIYSIWRKFLKIFSWNFTSLYIHRRGTKIRKKVQLRERNTALFPQRLIFKKISKFEWRGSSHDQGHMEWRKNFKKCVEFSLWGNRATTYSHDICFCTIFTTLAYYDIMNTSK